MNNLVKRLRLLEPCNKKKESNGRCGHVCQECIADAQLARAAWGLVDWLKEEASGWRRLASETRGDAVLWQAQELALKLEAAGIPRPKEASDERG